MADRRKPLSFDTTIRSPKRLAQFVSIINEFEGQILDKELIIKIEAEIIRQKLFIPTSRTMGTYKRDFIGKHGTFIADDDSKDADSNVDDIFKKWKDHDRGYCTSSEIEYLLKNTSTDHKEAGFDYGWASRLYTQTLFSNELGFIYFDPDEKIKISNNGKLLISKYSNGNKINDDNFDENPEHSAYLNAFAKYQTNNPWRHNTISINFLKLVLETLEYLDESYGWKGLNRRELSFVITWDNNDYKKLGDLIYKFRKTFSVNALSDDEKLFDYALNVLDPSTDNFSRATVEFKKEKKKDYKISKIIKETPDDVLRKLRLTQLISLRGNGYYLDTNSLEQSKIQYIIENIANNRQVEYSKQNYFEYMGKTSKELIFTNEYSNDELTKLDNVKQIALKNMSEKMDWSTLKKEIDIAGTTKQSSNLILREINKPTRMEFLSAIITKKAIPSARVVPHYKVDDEGIPYYHASGENGKSSGADIDVYYKNVKMLLEPTIGNGRAFQTEHEIPSIIAHYTEAHKDNNKNPQFKDIFSVFLAPKVIKPYVGDLISYYNNVVNTNIYAWESDDYLNESMNITELNDYQKIRPYAEPKRLK